MKKILIICFICISSIAHAGVQLSKSDLVYLGAFRVPQGAHGGYSFEGNTFVNAQYQPMGYNPINNSIFLGQKTGAQTSPKRIGEISIPALVNPADVSYNIASLNTATVLQNPQDVSEGDFDKLKTGGVIPDDEAKAQLGGLLVYDGKLFGTAWAYFDASYLNSDRSQWTANLDWTSSYNFSGLHTVGINPVNGTYANGGFVGGYMCEIPDEYKISLGYNLLTGRTGGPIVGRSSYGPTLWGFDPDDLDYDNAADAEMFIGYTLGHQAIGGYDDGPSLTFNRSSGVRGIIWAKGSSSILAFGQHGFGIVHDVDGVPTANIEPSCSGPGTSNRDEAKTNVWLLANSPSGWTCGYTEMTEAEITAGGNCCFDPTDASDKIHDLDYNVDVGSSCYGVGTDDYTYARTNAWLVANSSSGYD